MSTSRLIAVSKQQSLVLVADDEPALQQLLSIVIDRLGLAAVCVGDGLAALECVKAHRHRLACAILDIVMPTMNGVDAALTIQSIAPELPIILMTGAMPAHCADDIARLRLAGILPKPFALATLRQMLQSQVADSVPEKDAYL